MRATHTETPNTIEIHNYLLYSHFADFDWKIRANADLCYFIKYQR